MGLWGAGIIFWGGGLDEPFLSASLDTMRGGSACVERLHRAVYRKVFQLRSEEPGHDIRFLYCTATLLKQLLCTSITPVVGGITQHEQEKPGDVNKQLVEDCKEGDQVTHEEYDRREDVEVNGGEHDEEGEEEEEPSALETILPRLPAAQKEVFVKVEGVSGLSAPFTARGNAVYARIFWGGEEVRSRSGVDDMTENSGGGGAVVE